MFEDQVALKPQAVAVQSPQGDWTYAQLGEQVARMSAWLRVQGVARGDRVAILSENRREFVLTLLAAAKVGAIVACMNWRQTAEELAHCITLVTPRIALVSPRYEQHVKLFGEVAVTMIGEELESDIGGVRFASTPPCGNGDVVEPEDGLYILYTSGTTGKPKAALVSHRALVARGAVNTMDRGVRRGATFIAWPPMFHMASADSMLVTLIGGGKVIVMDGLDVGVLCDLGEREDNVGWFVLMPGMIDKVLDEYARRGTRPHPADSVGCMADLVPRQQIVDVTRLFNAPFRNTFGSTEAGPAPGSGGRVPVGVAPENLAKNQSSLCRVRLVDEAGQDVAPGEPGELLLRSPTLFSGYWGMPEATAEAFAGGWFHTGDVFTRQPDGTLQFVDRRKYLIKSGGENIYPAEIEQLLLASPRIADAAVVRKRDAKWGEVPVAFVAVRDETLSAEEVVALCRGRIANYKLPREVRFIRNEDMPRSTTGKIVRSELEALLQRKATGRTRGSRWSMPSAATSARGAPRCGARRSKRAWCAATSSRSSSTRSCIPTRPSRARTATRTSSCRAPPSRASRCPCCGTPAIRRSSTTRRGTRNPRAATSAACASAWSRPPRISSASTRKRTTCCRWSSATGCAGAAHCCCRANRKRRGWDRAPSSLGKPR